MAGLSNIPDPVGGGLFSSLKAVFSTLLESGKTRLELFANELQEEKLRLADLALLMLCMAFCLSAALLTAVLFLTALFWESRVVVLGMFSVAFTLAGFVFLFRMKRALSRPHGIFETTLAELREDIRQLNAAAGQDADPE
ncbi:MAG: phage holin family protein [Candidatus Accumulibacter sp.]|jgi:uncharacterized membrane protein YqjE|nr:phage holin family protein [Accumulibacter sp.]